VAARRHLPIHVFRRHPLLPVRHPDLHAQVRIMDLRRMEARHTFPQRRRRRGQ